MNEDGSDKKQITDIAENCMKPQWSPDGKQIVFYSDRGYIYLIRDAESLKSAQPFFAWSGYNPSFLEGGQIMFNNEVDDVLSIMVIDTASYGSEAQLLSDGRYSNMQTVTSDGNKVYYSGFLNGYKCIMVADLNDTTDNYITKVSKNSEANLEPDVSADGSKVVYASFNDNLQGTIRILQNGSETALSKGLPSSNVPRFSPDGQKIAFVVINDADVSLYVMNSDGSGKNNLNVKGGNVGTFQWMDNDRIVYDAGSESSTSIGVVNTDTGENDIIASGGFNLHPSVQK
ncbi:MAG: PD40 domain-containing protein [Ignavibacteria bacterium]|nr:PD40 domain-containing protein [Ignavibacteria bacterium]